MRAAWVFMLVMAGPGIAHAQSDARVAPGTWPWQPNAGYAPGIGFWVGDPRGVASLRAAVQPRFFCETGASGEADPCAADGFLLRRARVRLGAVLAEPSVELALQADLADEEQPLEEAYALVRPWQEVRIAAGLQRVPLLREGLYAEELLALAEVSPLAARVQPGQDLGLLLGLRIGRLDATIGVWNGAPRLFENDDVELLYAARMALDVIGQSPVAPVAGDSSLIARAVPGSPIQSDAAYVSLGIGGLYEGGIGDEGGNARVQVVVGDLAVRYAALSVDVAASLRETDRGAFERPADIERELGATAQVAWAFASPRIVPAARFTWGKDRQAAGAAQDRWQLGLGASWRLGAADLVTVLVEWDLEHTTGQDDVHRGLAELRLVL
jgi:hypothetical protein